MILLEWLTKAIYWMLSVAHAHPIIVGSFIFLIAATEPSKRKQYIHDTIQQMKEQSNVPDIPEIKSTENRTNHFK